MDPALLPDDEFQAEMDAEIALMDAECAEDCSVRKNKHLGEGSIIGDIIGTVIASAIGAAL